MSPYSPLGVLCRCRVSKSADHADALNGAFRLNEVPFLLLLGDLNFPDLAERFNGTVQYIGEICLTDDRAIVIRPRYLIGVSDGIKIETFWNFKIHNILAGRIRQIILKGKGRIFIYGYQGLQDRTAIQKDHKIESNRMIGYDAHAAYSLCRTETWWHYFRQEAELFDVKIKDGVFITQTVAGIYHNPNVNLLEKSINFILNGIGSILGL